MLQDLIEKAKKYPEALDWIDDHADLLDTNLVKYLTTLWQDSMNFSRTNCEIGFILDFLIDPDGAGFTKDELLGIIISDYKIGKWDGLDDWNKQCAGAGTGRADKAFLKKLKDKYNIYGSGRTVQISDMLNTGLEYVSYTNTTLLPVVGGANSYTILMYSALCKEKDLYVAVQAFDDMPEKWWNWVDSEEQLFSMYIKDDIRTVTSKNTLYFKPRQNQQSILTQCPFIMVSVDHIAKAGLDKAYVSTILPKKIVDKYNLPIVQY